MAVTVVFPVTCKGVVTVLRSKGVIIGEPFYNVNKVGVEGFPVFSLLSRL
jgi:hypothetical protein